jgi:uncharacterized ferritin-like protein (DUF455 family)
MNSPIERLRQRAFRALAERDAGEKSRHAKALHPDTYGLAAATANVRVPGRPSRPVLVDPRQLKHRSLASPAGRAVLFHALAHIEFNAINLALDAVWRYPHLSDEFALDWAKVASEEALHFDLLCAHLATLGQQYGDFPAHDGLWEMAEKTKDDPLARVALVPRTLEARGLDVSPAIRDKLKQAGDSRGAEILDLILRDEIGHVAIGNKWFRFLCAEQNLDPINAYAELAARYRAPALRGPFNIEARLQAGFEPLELEALQRAAAKGAAHQGTNGVKTESAG